ncbi:hypothetical protein ANCCAN_08002 [Ancylostoma caninum]|uniref:Bestrophin homolog n=1 Tax=Ancylostoma caninum TaxID=29170 RepID=A0A368GNM4_ANCCA|nr:hypothetical protein ANCCAN_08002 [Ancylostoma caninum]
MTILQFLFFVAWMKVAEALLNPLGEDDDDFECNFLIDRNIAIGMAIVDQTSDKFPTMKMDVLSDRDLMYMNYEKYDEGGHALVGSVSSITLPATSADAWSRQGSRTFDLFVQGDERELGTRVKTSTTLSRRSTMTHVSKSPADGRKQSKDVRTSFSIPTDPSDPAMLSNCVNSSMRRIHTTSLPPVNEEVAGSQDSTDGFAVIKL